jgi:hypothetical protein
VKVWSLSIPEPDPLNLCAGELETMWERFNGDDPVTAYHALLALSAAPGQAVPLVRERVQPAATDPTKTRRLARLIADLDSNQFDMRERAAKELANEGRSARPALLRALEGRPPLEVWRRVQDLLDQMTNLPASPEETVAERVVNLLERTNTSEGRDLLELLAAGAPDAWLTRTAKAALERAAKSRTVDGPPAGRE